jgi:uncharacterized protein (TIGR02145 family)
MSFLSLAKCVLVVSVSSFSLSAAAQSPWDTASVDNKVFIRFNAIVAGNTIDESSAGDKTYFQTLWDSLSEEIAADGKIYLKPVEAFNCGTSRVTYQGYAYETVLIGSQCWFAENLRAQNYTNGDPIDTHSVNSNWTSTTSGAVTVYDEGGANEQDNLAERGRLYNFYAASDARGICPSGWHVPTDAEFSSLSTFLGNKDGQKLKASAVDVPGWDGTNETGFSAIPAGYRFPNGSFNNEDRTAFWTSAPADGWDRVLKPGNNEMQRFQPDKTYGLSVRCLQDIAE